MIAVASDHGGFELKTKVLAHLREKGYECRDFGTDSLASCDYTDFGRPAAEAVASGECEKGIVICTTGIGISFPQQTHRSFGCKPDSCGFLLLICFINFICYNEIVLLA